VKVKCEEVEAKKNERHQGTTAGLGDETGQMAR
jgi:hypothetical protein